MGAKRAPNGAVDVLLGEQAWVSAWCVDKSLKRVTALRGSESGGLLRQAPQGAIRLVGMSKRVGLWLVSLCFALGPFLPASAQTDAWRSLIQQADVLYQQGWYEQAAAAATKALETAERDLGPEHPDVATSLNLLALAYRAKGEHGAAEPLYKRSLAIMEKILGAEHHSVAIAIGNLAELYQAQGRYAEAEHLCCAMWSESSAPIIPTWRPG